MHSGARVRNAWVTCPQVGNSSWKRELIPNVTILRHLEMVEGRKVAWGGARVPLASWWGNGPPRRRWVAGLRGRSATLGLRNCPDSYGRLQSRILGNGGNPDPAMPRAGWRSSDCKPLSRGTKKMTVPLEEATANYVPAAAVIRRWRALFGFIGRKGSAGGWLSLTWNPWA